MALKATCHITMSVLGINTYSNSAIESMYLRHVVISTIDKWTRFCFPDLPIVDAWTPQSAIEELSYLAETPAAIEEIGEKGHQFVLEHHPPPLIATQLSHLMLHTTTKTEQLDIPFNLRDIAFRERDAP
jgi:hypothetical protein